MANTPETRTAPSTPTIPSRFKTEKRRVKAERKGFGSTAARLEVMINPNPGPLSYSICKDLMLQKSPSVSMRGSFASKAVHRPDDYRPDTPGEFRN